MSPTALPPITAPAPSVVLDTNVVLDWLVFRNPGVAALVLAIEQRRVRWLGCPGMREELAHVAARPNVGAWGASGADLLGAWDRLACLLPDPPPAPGLRCRDASDQKFVDLATGSGARWLLTRDRALLALARKSAQAGLAIVPPERWHDRE